MLLVAVVGLVRQPDARLAQVQQIAGGVLGVGVDVRACASADTGALESADHRGERVGVGGVVDRGQLVEQRRDADPLDRGLVCEAGEQVADALLVGALLRLRRRSFGDQVADLLLSAVVQRPERAVGGAVGRDRVFGQPAAVHMAEEVVLGAGLVVDVAQVDARADCFYRHPTRVPEVRECATTQISPPPAPGGSPARRGTSFSVTGSGVSQLDSEHRGQAAVIRAVMLGRGGGVGCHLSSPVCVGISDVHRLVPATKSYVSTAEMARLCAQTAQDSIYAFCALCSRSPRWG